MPTNVYTCVLTYTYHEQNRPPYVTSVKQDTFPAKRIKIIKKIYTASVFTHFIVVVMETSAHYVVSYWSSPQCFPPSASQVLELQCVPSCSTIASVFKVSWVRTWHCSSPRHISSTSKQGVAGDIVLEHAVSDGASFRPYHLPVPSKILD